jgi:hypothetical protein
MNRRPRTPRSQLGLHDRERAASSTPCRVTEALAAETPVLASNLPSLRAVRGSGIVSFDPLDGPG